MSTASLGHVEAVVRITAQACVDNEKYFGELDSVVGDGDFGYSMARGFELVIQDWDGFDRADIGTFLKKIAVVITSRIGGTSGPIWGTAMLRAASTAGAVTRRDSSSVFMRLCQDSSGSASRNSSRSAELIAATIAAISGVASE